MSILDVTEQITLGELPEALPDNAAFPVNLQLASLWHREHTNEPERLWSTFELLLPDGEVFHHNGKTLEVDLETSPRTRLIFGIQAIPFRGAGFYWFHLYASPRQEGPWELIDKVPLEVVIKGAAASSISPEQRAEQTPSAPPESSSQRELSRPSRPRVSPKRRRRGSS
jgi:hypothetical protein